MDESSLVAAAFPFFFGAAAFPLGTAAFGVVSFGAVASFLGSGAAFGCVAARRLRSGFNVDAAAVTVALALLLLASFVGVAGVAAGQQHHSSDRFVRKISHQNNGFDEGSLRFKVLKKAKKRRLHNQTNRY